MSGFSIDMQSMYCYDSQIFITLKVVTTTKKGEFASSYHLKINKIAGSKPINNSVNNILLNINFYMASISL